MQHCSVHHNNRSLLFLLLPAIDRPRNKNNKNSKMSSLLLLEMNKIDGFIGIG